MAPWPLPWAPAKTQETWELEFSIYTDLATNGTFLYTVIWGDP